MGILDSRNSLYGAHKSPLKIQIFIIIFNMLIHKNLGRMARPKVIYADSHSSLLLAILKIWFYVNLPQKHYEKVKIG